ncbi:MAG: fasciclin domain-containing protein [Bacteroidales bacterium]|nr:fasciclin domain-containing protein [Bacteroidales bacterium]
MNIRKEHKLSCLIGIPVLISMICLSCKDPWDEYVKLNDDTLTENLMEVISNDPDLSTFSGLLEETGWDEMLVLPQMYTVWAPTNDALSNLDENYLTDPVKLNLLVAHHIVYSRYPYTNAGQEIIKLKMYSGKNLLLDLQNLKIEDASLHDPVDVPAVNGMLHVIDKVLIPKNNIWDFIEITALCPLHTGYMNSLTGEVFDPDIATQTGVDPVTGLPVYDTATGMVWNNSYINQIRDLSNEDSLFTVVLLKDNVFEQEVEKLKPYYNLDNELRTDSLTKWNICKDIVFSGIVDTIHPPDTLISLFGVKIPLSAGAIEQTYSLSNGIVMVLSNCDVRLQDRIQPIIIEAEDDEKYIVYNPGGGRKGYTRQKELASGGYDFVLDYHLANPGAIRYHVGYVNSVRYHFYWKAVDDFNGRYYGAEVDTIEQRLGEVQFTGYLNDIPTFGTLSPLHAGYIQVTDTAYETSGEVYIGEKLYVTCKDIWLQLTGSGNNTTITLDYIKLIPVFE